MAGEMDSDGEEAAAAAATTEGQGTSWAQLGCAVLRRGWWLGKKVAIAGVAFTSAPVVIPPLLLFSTLGVALSLPFGVYYASYTATEKVMRSLLPLPSLQTQDAAQFEDAEVEESEDEMELRFQFFESWEDGGVMLVEREDIYSEGEEEDDVGVLSEDEDGDQIEDLSFNSEEGARDTSKEEEIQLSYPPSLGTAVGCENEEVNEAEATINAEEEELYPEEEEMSPEVMNQVGGSIKMAGEEKPMEIATAIGGDNEAMEKRPPNTCRMVGMLPKVSEDVIESSSVGVQYTSIGEKWNEGSILTSENAEPRVEDIGKERESKVGTVDYAAAKVKEPLQEEHKLEAGPSASEQSGNQSGLELDDVCTSPGSENIQNDKDQKYTEMDDGQNKYLRNVASKEIEAAMENSAGAVSEHGIVMDHPDSQEDGGGIVVGEEKFSPSGSQTGGSISKEQEAGEIGSEVSLQMEYPSISDEKRNEGSKQILVKPKALEETREEREESEGESFHGTVTGVKQPLSQENKIEGEPIVVEQSAKEGWITMQENKIEGEPIAIEQSAKEGWITMMEEERSVQEQSQVEQKRAEEKGPGPTAADLESEGEPTALSSEYVSAVEDQFSDVGEADSRGSVERGVGIRFGHEMVGSNREVAASSDDEGLYNAQQMWEQIFAIRTIVGYKSVLHSSLVAELKSLYVFIGVEPPVSFNDTSDHAEVIRNLQFLKSVIGVL